MNRTVGGILLVVATSIGGGMLALPIANAHIGLWYSSLLIITSWMLMTFCALLIAEVNLQLPQNSNIISMACATLGYPGKIITWIIYLLLLYTLTALYIAADSEVAQMSLHGFFALPSPLAAMLISGSVIYLLQHGIHCVDSVNRVLILCKLLLYIALIVLITPHLSLALLQYKPNTFSISGCMVVITAFGFGVIIPSLRSYLNDDAKKLRFVILVGSVIPLCVYLLWNSIILGSLPINGDHGLLQIQRSDNPTAGIMNAYTFSLHNHWLTLCMAFFPCICVTTSLLAVSLGLSDFLADGLQIEKKGSNSLLIHALTFVPPIALVTFYPGMFITALSYAGTLCILLLVILPCIMAWSSRRSREKCSAQSRYQVAGGNAMLYAAILLGSGLIVLNLLATKVA